MANIAKDHHEFRFVIDGLRLSDEQRQHVATEVQSAGMRAMASLDLGVPTVAVDLGIDLDLDWIGRWILERGLGAPLVEVAQKLQQDRRL